MILLHFHYLLVISWTVGMAAMMFPSITPMVLLHNKLIRASGDGRDNTKDDMSHALVVEWDESPRRNYMIYTKW